MNITDMHCRVEDSELKLSYYYEMQELSLFIPRFSDDRSNISSHSTKSKKEFCIKINNDKLEIYSNSESRVKALLPCSIVYEISIFLQDPVIDTKVRKFIKESVNNNIDRDKSYIKIKPLVSDVANVLLSEIDIDKDESLRVADTCLLIIAYCFPHLINETKEISAFILDVFYFQWVEFQDFMSEPTVSRFSDALFREKRKTFRKFVKHLNPIEMVAIYRLSEYISSDEIESSVDDYIKTRTNRIDDFIEFDPNILNKFSRTVRKNILRSLFEHYEYTDDTFRMLEEYATDFSFFKGVKNISDLHDRAIKLIPDISEDKFFEVTDDGILKNSNFSIKEYDFKLLVNLKDFVSTGKTLDICIGSISYYENSVKGASYCYQIFKNDELFGALEVGKEGRYNRWKVKQLVRKKNNKIEGDEYLKDCILRLMNEELAKV